MDVVVTFDLEDGDANSYQKAYDMLEQLGLYAVSINKSLALPSTTVMGTLNVEIDAAKLRDFIWRRFEKAGLKPSALLGGVLESWAMRST